MCFFVGSFCVSDYAEGHELLCTSCSQENHSRYQYFINTYRSQSCTNSSFLKVPVCALLISHTTGGVKLRWLDVCIAVFMQEWKKERMFDSVFVCRNISDFNVFLSKLWNSFCAIIQIKSLYIFCCLCIHSLLIMFLQHTVHKLDSTVGSFCYCYYVSHQCIYCHVIIPQFWFFLLISQILHITTF